MRSIKRRMGKNAVRANWTMGLLSLTALSAVCSAAYAQDTVVAPVDKIISIDLRDVRLEAAVSALSNSTGLNNVVIQAIPGKTFQLVNVKLVDQPMSRALKAITESAGGILTETDGIYYIRPKTDADVNPTAKPEPGALQSDESKRVAASAREAFRNRQWGKIRLTYILPSEIVKYLDNPNYIAEVTKDSDVLFPKSMFEDNSARHAAPVDPSTVQNPPASGTNSPATSSSPIPVAPVSGSTGGVAGGAGRADDSYTAGQRGIGPQGAGGIGGAGGQNRGGQGGPGGVGNQAASILPPGISNVISNDADNALLVAYDDVVDFDTLKKIISYLDVAPKQVEIKAEFINVSVSDADSFGINWHFQPAGNLDALIPAATGQSGTASILLAYSSGNAVANLQATLSHDTSNVLQAPIVTTVNNKLATIQVTTEVSVPETIVVANTTGTPTTYTNQIGVTAVNGLNVLPHINGDGTISMFLTPQLQTVAVTADGGISATTERLSVYRRVASGETMVLGGFINKTDSVDLQKVPILSDLPIIGNLFTQKSHSVVGSEILVFVTATIIDDHAAGSTGVSSAPSP